MNPIKNLKLGKLPALHDPRTLKFTKYGKALPPSPASVDWTKAMGFIGLMLNDKLGCCTIAAAGHMIQAWTGLAKGSPYAPGDGDIVKAYEQIAGYDPKDPSTDRGAVEIEVLNAWRKNGLGPAGHKIAAYVSVNIRSRAEVLSAVNLFGGLYAGVALPISAQEQTGPGRIWDLVAGGANSVPGSWGGHAVPILGYDLTGTEPEHNCLTVITWGARQMVSPGFFNAYFDEAYAIVTDDWIAKDAVSPSGFDLKTLMADLELL